MSVPVTLLWCRHCLREAWALRTECCPACGCPGDWVTQCPAPHAKWVVSRKDWVFLRIQKINPERATEEL